MKHAYAAFKHAETEEERKAQQTRCFALRREWFAAIWHMDDERLLKKGKLFQKSKKLWQIEGVERVDEDSLAESSREAAGLLERNIAKRWNCGHYDRLPKMIDFMKRHDGEKISFSVEDFVRLLPIKAKHRGKLDSKGICIKAFEIVAIARPRDVKNVLLNLIASTDETRDHIVEGSLFGKKSKNPKTKGTRAILPLDTILTFVDMIIAHFLDKHLPYLFPYDFLFMHCAEKYRQTTDIVDASSLIIEKNPETCSLMDVLQ